MRATTLLLTIALAATAFGAPSASDAQGVSTGTTQELAERTVCLEWFGFRLGTACYGSWGKDRYNRYKNQCGSFGYDSGYRAGIGGSFEYRWGTYWIAESNWSWRGDFWLPKEPKYWGCVGPAPWKPRGRSTPDCFNKYKDACRVRGYEPHYYWDSVKSGYYYLFDGTFYFEAEFSFTADGRYWVPRSCDCHPGPVPTVPRPIGGPGPRALAEIEAKAAEGEVEA